MISMILTSANVGVATLTAEGERPVILSIIKTYKGLKPSSSNTTKYCEVIS